MIHTSLFDTMFSEDYLRTYFLTTLINRNGGGRDLMTPRKWWESNKQTLDRLALIFAPFPFMMWLICSI